MTLHFKPADNRILSPLPEAPDGGNNEGHSRRHSQQPTISDLPLNGCNYINLLTVRPGATVYSGGGADTRSSHGSRPEDLGYLFDGFGADEAYTAESVLNAPIPAGDSGTPLPIDAIQEFNTEGNPKAEFGWKPAAVVNVDLKSGTNIIHGTAFAFGRDTALDAPNGPAGAGLNDPSAGFASVLGGCVHFGPGIS